VTEAVVTLVGLGLAVNAMTLGPEIPVMLPDVVILLNDLNFRGCWMVAHQPSFFIWIAPLVFETILCLLMLYKAWRLYTEDWRNPLLGLLIRDRCVRGFASSIETAHTVLTSYVVSYTS
jgi:hypothetical protein